MEKFAVKQVTDLNLVAYLLTVGFTFLNAPRFSLRFTVFEFRKSPELEAACVSFYGRAAKVDALTLCENLRIIKSMVQELQG